MFKKVTQLFVMLLSSVGKTFNIIAAIVFFVGGLTIFSAKLNLIVFREKEITNFNDKIQVAQTLGIWLSLYIFSFSIFVMTFRMLSGKFIPSTVNDPVLVNASNRVITNTIEQSIIFAGLFLPILFNNNTEGISGKQLLVIASLFVIGRLTYAIGYLIGSVTDISSFRSFGFAIGLFINLTLAAYHFGVNSFHLLEVHGAPVIKNLLG